MAPSARTIVLFSVMATIAIAAPDVDAVMTERPEGVSEAVWSEEGSTNDQLLQAEDSDTGATLRRKQAVAAAHVDEDKASLALSSDAQALEHLKGQMSLEVVHAKQELVQSPDQHSPAAHRAASIAKKVMSQTQTVQKDQTKERLAKLKVHEADQLLAASVYSQQQQANDKKQAISSHLERAAGNLAKELYRTKGQKKTKKKQFKKKTFSKGKALSKVAGEVSRALDSPTSRDKDPISRELGDERDKYRQIEHQSAQAVENDKHDVAESETTIQDLADKLAKAKAHLRKGNFALKKHLRQHELTEHLYLKYSAKESHYKKMHALKAQISRQEDQLRLQQMKIRDSKEMLTKSLSKEQALTTFKARREHATHRRAVRVGYSNPQKRLMHATPAVNAAVSAVSANLGHQHIAKELEPQIANLKASGLTGEHLKLAIDHLVAKTVKSKVSTAFKNDPTVSNAVRKAARQVQARRSKGTASEAVFAAKHQVMELDDAGRQLHAAESKLDEDRDEEEEMVQDLEQVWGSTN